MSSTAPLVLPLPCPPSTLRAEQATPSLPRPAASQVPNGASGFYLLGRIYQLSNRHSAAIAYYATALQLDPMLWSAFEELCALGADTEAQQYLALAAAAGAGPGSAAPSATAPAGGSPQWGGFGTAAAGGVPAVAAAMAGAGMASPSSSSFPPVATPSVGQQQHQGSASGPGPAPMSTAATKTGLGAMFSWMDTGRQRGTAGGTAARVGACQGPRRGHARRCMQALSSCLAKLPAPTAPMLVE